MGFLDKLKDFVSGHKIIVGTVGAAAAVAIGYFVYLAATDDQFLDDPAEFTKQTSHQQRQIIELKKTFDKNDPAQIGKLFEVFQNGLEEISKKTQQQFKEKRLEAKTKSPKHYFEAIAQGMQALGESVSEVQNKLFYEVGITEQEFEMLCSQHPNVINQALMRKFEGQGQEAGEILSQEELRNILRIQREFLTKPTLVRELQEATQELPMEAINQIPMILAVMLGDCVQEKMKFDEDVFNRSLGVHGQALMRDLQQQQMLLQQVVTRLMSGIQGMGGMGGPGRAPQDFMNGNPAELAAMMGMQPEDLANDKLMQGDNEMLMKMMQSLSGSR